jgi:hypothetical protein
MSLSDSIVALSRTGSLLYFHLFFHSHNLVTIRVFEVHLFKVVFQTDPSFHMNLLCRSITVSSKTEMSQRVAILHLGRKSLAENVKSGSVWKVLDFFFRNLPSLNASYS